MDPDELEDMLFGFNSSQDSLDDVGITTDFEEDMLDDGFDSEFGVFDLTEDTDFLLWEEQADDDAEMLDYEEAADPEVNDFHEPDAPALIVKDRNWVIARVEALLERIVDSLLADNSELSIVLKSRANLNRRDKGQKGAIPPPKIRKISFPGASAQEAWRFTALLRVLEIVHECLVGGVTMTKRDIYYRHPDLFVKQSMVDRYVDDLACTFGVPRSLLNVTAAAKGLAAGNFTLLRADGTLLNGLSEKEGILMPKVEDPEALDLSSIRWTLVIEKEATFRAILGSPQWKCLGSQGLIVTAKGYPDLDSRKFLRQVADRSPHIPMYCLVDFDPDGIAIMSTYKHGSYRLAHETITTSGAPGLELPQLRWLGVQSHQLCRTPVGERDTTGHCTTVDDQGLMRLTPRDRTKACRMLEWDLCAEDGPEPEWRSELQTMLMLNVKAEMQIFDERPGGLVGWLESELSDGAGEDEMLEEYY